MQDDRRLPGGVAHDPGDLMGAADVAAPNGQGYSALRLDKCRLYNAFGGLAGGVGDDEDLQHRGGHPAAS